MAKSLLYGKKICAGLLYVSLSLGCLFFLFGGAHAQQDLLENAFYPAKTYQTIVDLGNTKNAVGNELLRQSVGVQNSLGLWCFVNNQRVSDSELDTQISTYGSSLDRPSFCQQILWWTYNATLGNNLTTTQAPLIVSIAKWMLRITIVLSITMVIFNGIMYIIEAAKGAEVKDTAKNLWYIAGGILLALLSLGIINLITSLTASSLQTTWTSQWCFINGSLLVWDNLKKYICENSNFGTSYTWTWDANRLLNRCTRNGTRTAITDTEMTSKCIELWWTYQP